MHKHYILWFFCTKKQIVANATYKENIDVIYFVGLDLNASFVVFFQPEKEKCGAVFCGGFQ